MSLPPGKSARWIETISPMRWRCLLCPHHCQFTPDHCGRCGLRRASESGVNTLAHHALCSIAIDPIEKKPLNQFLPGSTTLSLGTVGCNLSCRFCQNWSLSRGTLSDLISTAPADPPTIVETAKANKCQSVSFTYNDPIIWAELALDISDESHSHGLQTVAVTNGFIAESARMEFFNAMDATNIDLKSFSDDFYRSHCGASLNPVLETIEYVAHNSKIWLEITTLLIPGLNDSREELIALFAWLVNHTGRQTPIHLSRFFPAGDYGNIPLTPIETLLQARDLALAAGLQHVYIGNVQGYSKNQTT